MTSGVNKQAILISVLEIGICGLGYYYLSKYIYQRYQPKTNRPSSRQARDRLEKILLDRASEEQGSDDDQHEDTRSKRRSIETLELNEYEAAIAQDVIDPSDITITFRQVGGISEIKAELWDLVISPLLSPDLFRSESGLVTPPRGILLYGAPGTGKTMLAKAIAKESGATFVNVRLSSIMDKWFGESNKLIAATFSLAQKLAPSVIFIDEIDTFLSQRDSSEGSATTSMKSEFLTLWDGMTTDSFNSAPVTVLGATNRPYDVDSAILRRLPRTFEIGLPDFNSRIQILQLFLEKQSMTKEARNMIPALSKITEGYSGSDLKELCRAAAMEPIREMIRESSRRAVMGKNKSIPSPNTANNQSDNAKSVTERQNKTQITGPPRGAKVRPVNEKDFAEALKKVKRSGETARTYLQRENSTADAAAKLDMNELARGMQLLQMMMSEGAKNKDSSINNNTSGDKSDDIPEITE